MYYVYNHEHELNTPVNVLKIITCALAHRGADRVFPEFLFLAIDARYTTFNRLYTIITYSPMFNFFSTSATESYNK